MKSTSAVGQGLWKANRCSQVSTRSPQQSGPSGPLIQRILNNGRIVEFQFGNMRKIQPHFEMPKRRERLELKNGSLCRVYATTNGYTGRGCWKSVGAHGIPETRNNDRIQGVRVLKSGVKSGSDPGRKDRLGQRPPRCDQGITKKDPHEPSDRCIIRLDKIHRYFEVKAPK